MRPSTAGARRGAAVRVFIRVIQRLLLALYRKRVSIFVALVAALGIGGYLYWHEGPTTEVSADGGMPIEVSVQLQPRPNGAATMTLREKNGSRRIAMDVTGAEVLTIAREQGYQTQIEPPRSFDLLRDVIQQLGGHLDRVVINDANATNYFAHLVISANGETRQIKARPSDAVALALRARAPIFVEDRVFQQSGAKGSG